MLDGESLSREMQLFFLMIASFFLVAFMWFEFGSRYVGYLYNKRTQSRDFSDFSDLAVNLLSYESGENMDLAFATFARKGVRVVIGPPTSTEGKRIAPYLRTYKMRAFSATITSDALLSSGLFYSLSPSNRTLREILEKVMTNLGVRKLLIVLDPNNRAYSEEFLPLLRKFQGEAVTYSEKEVLSGLSKVNVSDFDAALITTYSKEAAKIAKILREQTPNIRLFGADSVFSEDLIRFGGRYVDGMLIVYPYDSPDAPELAMIRDCIRILEEQRFLSSEQFARFLDRNKVRAGDGFVCFKEHAALRPINIFVVREKHFEMLGKW